jgi:hypothetical protein
MTRGPGRRFIINLISYPSENIGLPIKTSDSLKKICQVPEDFSLVCLLVLGDTKNGALENCLRKIKLFRSFGF